MSIHDISLSGGGDAVVSGVGESVWCQLGDDGSELDVCGCDSLVSDWAGDSCGVEVVDDVARGDDTLLHDAVRVAGRLSLVGDTLVCDSGVARSGRGDAGMVVGPWVAQPGWVDSASAQTVPCGPSHHR